MDKNDREVRYAIFQFYLEYCRPPTVQELIEQCRSTNEDIVRSLRNLADLHHLRLYENHVASPTPIAMVHPFSHLPTPYTVIQKDKVYWANCTWCAFGLAAMLSPGDVLVNVLTPCTGSLVSCTLSEGEIVKTVRHDNEEGNMKALPAEDLHVTFSPPPSKWWDDVRFACSTIQLCCSKAEADGFFQSHGCSSLYNRHDTGIKQVTPTIAKLLRRPRRCLKN